MLIKAVSTIFAVMTYDLLFRLLFLSLAAH